MIIVRSRRKDDSMCR